MTRGMHVVADVLLAVVLGILIAAFAAHYWAKGVVMKMAKASEADMAMAMELAGALEALASHWGAHMPEKIERIKGDRESERFDLDDTEQCRRVVEYLIGLTRSASLFRVVYGMAVLLDPRNKVVDPNSDTLEHYTEAA